MKIGILTHHWVFNYGANLQTLSTVCFLRNNGHEPFVINWVQEDAEEYYYKTTETEMADMFRKFQEEYYPLTLLCRSAKDIADVIKQNGIEKVIIGSDTVFMLHSRQFSLRSWKWTQPTSESVFPNPFWGEFLDYGIDIPVIAYSAATLDLNLSAFKSKREEIGRYLKRFKIITTRDQYTSEIISFFTRGAMVPVITPDPVFSFNNNFIQNLSREDFLNKYHLPNKYILVCFTEGYQKKATAFVNELNNLTKKSGYELIELPRQTGRKLFDIKHVDTIMNPIEWYNMIRFSNGFIGQLMHPIVISIHNSVPFFCIDYYGRRKFRATFIDYKTSKAYQIINQVEKVNCYKNIAGRFDMMPSPKYVLESILSQIDHPDYSITEKMNKKSDNSMKLMLE